MKFFNIAIAVLFLSCNEATQLPQDPLIEASNLKIKLLKQRGDSIEKANTARFSNE